MGLKYNIFTGNFDVSGFPNNGVISGSNSSVDGSIAVFSGTTGTVLKSSLPTIDNLGNIVTTGTLTASNFSGVNTGDVTLGTANGLSLSGQQLSLTASSGVTTGALSSADWNTFNNKQPAGSYITSITGDVSATGPGTAASIVNSVGGSSASNVHTAELLANAATDLNTVSTIVKRDATGNFSAGTITATLNGNATNITATSNSTLTTLSALSLPGSQVTGNISGNAANVTGIVAIANGGTNSSTALNNNRIMQSSAGSIIEVAAITASRALISDANGIPTHSSVTSTELGYVSGVTSAIQTQLNTATSNELLDVRLDGSRTMTGALNMGGFKVSNAANGTLSNDLVTFSQLQAVSNGNIWLDPVLDPDLVDDSLSTPPGSPVSNTTYLIGASPTGAWTGLAGHLVYWSGSTWVDVLGRVVQVGDRFGVTLEHGNGSEGGNMVGNHNKIAQLTNATPGSYAYTFTTPVTYNAVFVNNSGSQHFAHSYTYNGTSWIEFGGPSAIPAGNALSYTGNTLNVLYDNSTIDLNGSNQLEVKASGITGTQIAAGAVDLTTKVIGTLPIANGGTGQTTQQTAIDALTGTQSAGKYLRSDGTHSTLSSLAAADLTGTVAIANGGTGQSTQTAAFNALSPLTTKGDVIVFDGTNNVRLSVGTNGQVLTADSTQTDGVKWATPSTGSVSSVALADGSTVPIYSISGSPVTSSGTLTFTLSTQTANKVLAGPTTGAAAQPTFRSLVSADIPSISLTAGVSGVLPIANGGTNSSTALNNNRVMISSGGSIVEQSAITANRALASDASGLPVASTTTSTELGYVSGVTSSIQTQINGKLTASAGDINETSFTAADNQATPANITGLAFANATVRSFEVQLSIVRGTTYAVYRLDGIQRASDWALSQSYTGDVTGLTFSITTAGQIQYVSTSTGSSATVKFRALTLSV